MSGRWLLIAIGVMVSCVSSIDRSKRFLIFPQASPTRHQFVAGVGIPLDLPQISVISGYVLRGNYYLPYKVQQLIPMFLKNETILEDEIWERLNRTDFLRKKREEGETLEPIEYTKIQDSENFNSKTYNSRWTFYDIVIGAIESQGHPGKPCLLRAICEASTIQFTHFSGVIGELFHVLLNPSTSDDKIMNQGHYKYYYAEEAGKRGKPCDKLFKECEISILELFSHVHEY